MGMLSKVFKQLNGNWCTMIVEKGVKFKNFYVISNTIVTDGVFEMRLQVRVNDFKWFADLKIKQFSIR